MQWRKKMLLSEDKQGILYFVALVLLYCTPSNVYTLYS